MEAKVEEIDDSMVTRRVCVMARLQEDTPEKDQEEDGH